MRGTPAASLSLGHIDSLELLDFFAKECGVPRVIYDVGANVGTWTQLAKFLFPAAKVHAFEPLDKHTEAFKSAIQNLSDVSLHSIALGASSGSVQLHVTDFSDATSVLPLASIGAKTWGLAETHTTSVRITTLDSCIRENLLEPPDLIKLDVQGFELDVLRGAESALELVSGVLTELSFSEFYTGQCLAHEVSSYLAARGFKLASLGTETQLGRRLLQADALFLK